MASSTPTTSIPLQEPVFSTVPPRRSSCLSSSTSSYGFAPSNYDPQHWADTLTEHWSLEPTWGLPTSIFWLYECFHRRCEFFPHQTLKKKRNFMDDLMQPSPASSTCSCSSTGCPTWPFQALVYGSHTYQEKTESQGHSQSTRQTPPHFEQVTFALT